MVGSKSWFNYVTDAGTTYAIQLDRSNTLATNPTTGTATPTAADALPRNIRPRYGLFSSADGLTRRKVVILTPTEYGALSQASVFTPQGTTVQVSFSYGRGESRRVPRIVDTGLTT